MMTNEMRTTLYSTKVRSLALLGADIWGWRRAYRLDKSDAKSLRILTRAHTRTKLEAMLWLVGLYPIWVLAAVQAFDFYSGTWRCYGKSSLRTVEAMLQIA